MGAMKLTKEMKLEASQILQAARNDYESMSSAGSNNDMYSN